MEKKVVEASSSATFFSRSQKLLRPSAVGRRSFYDFLQQVAEALQEDLERKFCDLLQQVAEASARKSKCGKVERFTPEGSRGPSVGGSFAPFAISA